MSSVPVLSPTPFALEASEQKPFQLVSPFSPSGDQPTAIRSLVQGIHDNKKDQVLLGVTASGKTYTMACVIQEMQRPTLIMAHNKILAAQLYSEFKTFFPHNAVEYFVSYYDYYQPEAYVPKSDTYIAKESTVNEQIDQMRHSATRSLLERRDVIIVSSVSCIYGLGAVESYGSMVVDVRQGATLSQKALLTQFVDLQYKRNDMNFVRGSFRVRGDIIDIWPSHYEDRAWRLSLWGDEIDQISEFDPLTGQMMGNIPHIRLYPNSHYVTPQRTLHQAMGGILEDLDIRLKELNELNKLLEAQRLSERTNFDIEMLKSTGICQGIENYSRYLSGRPAGSPPPTLFEYFPKDNSLLFVDESHVTVPQIGAMYKGDASRKRTLYEHGFRLPSCADNRPLKFEEWNEFRPQTIYVSATPAPWELEQAQGQVAQQLIRPTGLIDPVIDIRPVGNQVEDLMGEIAVVKANGGRILVTALTKKMAEQLTDYFLDNGIAVKYMHADTETLERIQIVHDLRLGVFDVLVGINLLREGLDIPECKLVAVLDADKEGFLRSETSLIQTIGRAARNSEGRVILYADKITKSIDKAMKETQRRREYQIAYNTEHGITPTTTLRSLSEKHGLEVKKTAKPSKKDNANGKKSDSGKGKINPSDIANHIASLEKKMIKASEDLDFELAAEYRDEIGFYRTLLIETKI